MTVKLIAGASVAAALFVAPAFAHHSFSMFDADKTVTLTGTVKEFEWTNPHAWLRIMVNDQARVGWKPDSVKPGDKVTVTIHPLKDGSRGGQFITAMLPNGTMLGNGGQKPSATGE